MKANEIRNMTVSELEAKLADLKKDLFMLRMQHIYEKSNISTVNITIKTV